MTSQELIVKETATDAFMGNIVSSINAETQEERLQVYTAVSNAEPLGDHLDEIIMIEHVIIQPVIMEDARDGEERSANRIVIVDPDGNAYGCTSTGVETSMRNLFAIVGNPPYNPALPMKVCEKKGNNGFKFFTLEYAPVKSSRSKK